MEGGGVNKEEKEAASPTCTKVATSLRDKMEPFFTKKQLFEVSIYDTVTSLRLTEIAKRIK